MLKPLLGMGDLGFLEHYVPRTQTWGTLNYQSFAIDEVKCRPSNISLSPYLSLNYETGSFFPMKTPPGSDHKEKEVKKIPGHQHLPLHDALAAPVCRAMINNNFTDEYSTICRFKTIVNLLPGSALCHLSTS